MDLALTYNGWYATKNQPTNQPTIYMIMFYYCDNKFKKRLHVVEADINTI